jgi:hypothetical protein
MSQKAQNNERDIIMNTQPYAEDLGLDDGGKFSVVIDDGREVFSDCTKSEAEHFARGLPKHVKPMVVPSK